MSLTTAAYLSLKAEEKSIVTRQTDLIMQALSILLELSLVFSAVQARPPPPPLPADVIKLAGAEPTVVDPGVVYQNNSALLKQVQLSQYIRNGQIALYSYSIENIPKFGFSGYPREIIYYLQVWRAVSINMQSPIASLRYPTLPQIIGLVLAGAL